MRLKITSGENIWLIAGESQARDDGNYQSRLLNELKLSQSLTALGSAPVTLNISVRNDDGYISPAIDLWGALVEITADGGTTWSGTITAYDSDGDGVTYLVATEKAAPELTIQMPDEVARLVTVDENFHSSAVNVTLPLVFGGNSTKPHLIKGILIDKTQGIYLLCVGEIHQVVKVYRGTEEITTGFTAYTGTAGQTDYTGFAYVQLTDEAIRKNDDGSYVEISADVIGLKLGSATIEQCRNGARVLYYLLTTAKDGVCGWGLGIATSEINTTAFNQAISDVDAAGLKFDGIFYFRQAAQSWIDQICLAIRGAYSIGRDGKRALFINKSAASAKTYTETNMRMLRHGVGAYTGRVYNKGKLDFDYNPITGQFMQSAQFENAVSVAAIGEQEFYGQSYLIKDMATAQAILEYTCKKSLIGARKVYFETDELPTGARSGTVINIDRPDLGVTGDYQIINLEIGDHVHTIEAEKFDASIFAVGTPGTAIDWTKDPPIIPTINPGAASGLTLSSEVRPSPDGTNIIVLKGTFTPPAGKYLAASIEWGEGALPILSWNSLGMVQGNGFEIAPVKPAQAYAVRVRMTTSTGHSDYVTATITTEGDEVPPGAPSIGVTSYLKTVKIAISLASVPSDMAGFAIYRHTSNNSAAASQIGSITSKDGRATYTDEAPAYGATYYYWVKSFDTWGNLSAFSSAGSTLITAINGADIVDGALSRSALFAAGVVDAAAIGAAAVTAAKTSIAAINAATGNLNNNVVGELQLANDAVTAAKLNVAGIDGTTGAVAAGAVTELQLAASAVTEAKIAAAAVNTAQLNNAALKAPLGAVLSLSAKNCTAASIAEVYGVRDVSGNMNHGQAFGGVAVVDTEIGRAFQFDGSNDWMATGNVVSSKNDEITMAAWVRPSETGLRGIIGNLKDGVPRTGVNIAYETQTNLEVNFSQAGVSTNFNVPIAIAINELAFIAMTVSGRVFKSYKNAELVHTYTASGDLQGLADPLPISIGSLFSNTSGYVFAGQIMHPRVYDRALTPSEIKSLYMFPDDAVFGNITADLLSTGELITKTAQIKDAIITSAKINDLSADKINAGTLAAARIATGSLAADKITGGALVVGGAAGDVNAGATTINGGKITASSVTASQLASNSVTTDKLAAGSVTSAKVTSGELITLTAQIKDAVITDAKVANLSAAKLTTGTLDAERIAAGSITGAKIAASTITSEKILIGKAGAALNDDPNFEDPSAWTGGSPTFATVSDGIVGANVMRHTGSEQIISTRAIVIDRNKTYRARVWVRSLAANSTNRFYFRIGQYGGLHSSLYLDVWSGFPGTAWEEHFLVIPGSSFPAGTLMVPVFIFAHLGTVQREIQDFRLEEVLPATLIQDGAITTDKINVAGLNASVIKAGTIDAARIAAGSLSADKITGGAIVVGGAAGDVNSGATTIAGGKITAASITVSQLNSGAIKAPADPSGHWPAKGSSVAGILLSGGVKDISGNRRNATAYGNTTIADSAIGKIFSFDGTGDYILTDSSAVFGGSTSISFACWLKPTATGFRGIISNQFSGSPRRGLSVTYETEGNVEVNYTVSGGSNTSRNLNVSLPLNELNHLVVTLESGTFKVYKNGELVTTDATGHSIVSLDSSDKAVIGRVFINSDSYYFSGQIGDPRIYSRALTAAEVKTLYMIGTDTESGTITADRVVTGQLKSTNYSTTAGSLLDLDNGNFTVGGSAAPVFALDAAAKTGQLSGFSFNVADMTAGSGSTAIGISTDTAKKAFWAGHATPASAPFYVSHDGTGKWGNFTLSASGFSSTYTGTPSYTTLMKSSDSGANCGFENTRTTTPTDYAKVEIRNGGIYLSALNAAGAKYISVNCSAATMVTIDCLDSSQTGIRINTGNIYIGNNCSALSFTDRTEMPESMDEALEIINTMQPTQGKVDYKRLSNKAKKFTIQKAEDGGEYIEEGRDLTKTVSALVMICQKLQEEIIRLSDRLAKLEAPEPDEEREYIEAVDKTISENRGNIRVRMEAGK